MGKEIVNESWFSNLRWTSWKGAPEADKAVIGVLAFEVAGLMSKVVNLWHCLSDKEIQRLRQEVKSSVGIQKLVSDNDDYLMDLALNEIVENFGLLSRSVARLGRKCVEAPFCRFEEFVNDPIQNNFEWFGWQYRLKKMERKVKKMEKFVAVTMQLSQELEVLAELERTLRRIQANADSDRGRLLDYQHKVLWQRQEVKNLREMSPWVRTCDYTVRLLARSLLTILERIKYVFDVNQLPSPTEYHDLEDVSADFISRTHSFSALMQSSVHPSENILCGFSSGSLGRSDSMSRFIAENTKVYDKQQKFHRLNGKNPHLKANRLAHFGPLKGCMSGSDSPILHSYMPVNGGSMRLSGDHRKSFEKMEKSDSGYFSCSSVIYCKLALFSSKRGLLNAPASTLGNAALTLHYANVIVLIEKLASSPHMVDLETRDDLYNMLPTTIRAALRARLKAYAKSLNPFVYDASLAQEWSLAIAGILDWLSPLAHKTIRWQSERNFEREQEFSRTNVVLVQTLHYANQAKTEAAITELLVGLNYICRINREISEKALPRFLTCKASNSYVGKRDDDAYNVV